ncbi:MAG: trypsin-like peptidase domain-containing protein [Clostridia bacterium]
MICKDCGFKYEGKGECPACGSKNTVDEVIKTVACENAKALSYGEKAVSRSSCEDDWQATFDNAERSMITLYGIMDNAVSKGTGFYLNYHGDNFYITNYHVIEDCEAVVGELPSVVDLSRQRYNIEVVAADTINDLAALKLQVDIGGIANFQNRVALQLSDLSDVKIGQEVCTRGNPRNFSNVLTVGRISGLGNSDPVTAFNNFGSNKILVDITATHGSSGGAVCVKNGDVVGVVEAGTADMPNQITCVSAFAVSQMLAGYMAKRNNKAR